MVSDAHSGCTEKHTKLQNPVLNNRQANFCRLIIQGKTKTDAYREAYNKPTLNAQDAGNRGARLAARPLLKKTIADGIAASMVNATKREVKLLLTVNDRLDLLAKIAASKSAKPSDRIRAVEAYSKIAGDSAPQRLEVTGANGGPIEQQVKSEMEVTVLPVRERLARFRQSRLGVSEIEPAPTS